MDIRVELDSVIFQKYYVKGLLVQMHPKEEIFLGNIVGSVEISLMLIMLSIFRNSIKEERYLRQWINALVFKEPRSEILETS